MDNRKLGAFIAEMRRERNFTQKDLAKSLNITDKAVSKWERGVSCPDIALLIPLSELLGVTVNELLCGEKDSGSCNCEEDEQRGEVGGVENVIIYADKKTKSDFKRFKLIASLIFSIVLCLGIAVCAICDLAISRRLTWSLIPIASIVFAWFAAYPLIRCGFRAVPLSLAAVTVLIIPYLAVLDRLIDSTELILPIGARISVMTVVYLWVVFALFTLLCRRKFLAGAFAVLGCELLDMGIYFCLSRYNIDAEFDLLNFYICIVTAIGLFIMDYVSRKKQITERHKE